MRPSPTAPAPIRPADVRWNFLMNLGDYALFWFGYNLMLPPTMMTLYVSYLTNSNLLISLTPALAGLGWSVPQLLGARWAMAQPVKKWYTLRVGIPGRVAIVALTLVTLYVAGPHPEVALPLTLLLLCAYRVTSGLTTPGWTDMIAKTIPGPIRGRFLGAAQCVGGVLAALGLLVARVVLDTFPFPTNFALCFGAGTIAICLGQVFLGLVREPPSTDLPRPAPLRVFFGALPGVARRDPSYLRYLGGRALLLLSTLAVPLLTVYAVRGFGVEAGEAALAASAMLVAQTVATLGWGWLVDRFGSKLVIELAGVVGGLGALVALLAPSPLWLLPAFALVGISNGGYQVADGSIVIEYAPPNDRPRYVGLTNTALAPVQLAAPLAGGLIADRLGYDATFGAALGLALAGYFVLVRFVPDPRRRPAAGA